MVVESRLEELVPQLPDNPEQKIAVLSRARDIVSAFWPASTDPVLAMALQVVVQLPAAKDAACAAIEAMQQPATLAA